MLLTHQPASEPIPEIPRLIEVVLAKLICGINDSGTTILPEDGLRRWHTDCIDVHGTQGKVLDERLST